MYKLCPKNSLTQEQDSVWRLNDDGVAVCGIPFDPANVDFQAYQKWLAEGNQPLPAEE